MIIQTMDKIYTVIKYIDSSEVMERYVCRENSDGKCYTIIRIKDKNLIIKTMDYLIKSDNNEKFSDFISYFTSDECLNMVFKFHEGISLEEKLKLEASSLTERLELANTLIEQMTLQMMPEYLQYNCLNKDSIVVTSSGNCFFLYNLENLYNYEKYNIKDVFRQLSIVINNIFEEETSKHKIEALEEFIIKVRTGEFENYIEVYKEYQRLKEYIEQLDPNDIKIPNTWIFRVWEKIKKIFMTSRKFIIVILLLVAFIFLIYTIKESMNAGKKQQVFERIGTLEIQK